MGPRAEEELTEKQLARIVKMHRAGYSLRVIGERFGLNYSAISRILRKLKAYDAKKTGNPWK